MKIVLGRETAKGVERVYGIEVDGNIVTIKFGLETQEALNTTEKVFEVGKAGRTAEQEAIKYAFTKATAKIEDDYEVKEGSIEELEEAYQAVVEDLAEQKEKIQLAKEQEKERIKAEKAAEREAKRAEAELAKQMAMEDEAVETSATV